MYIADLNVVFGKEEESLVKRINDIVIPAMNSESRKKITDDTYYLFDNVQLTEISKNEWVIQGILVKDTVVDVLSEYSVQNGISETNKKVKTAPYSLFIIYLKNHRMILVKNQNSSPSIKSFGLALRAILSKYVKEKNKILRQNKEVLLPFPIVNVTGVKTSEGIKKALENVEKINELIFKFYPLNAEWDFSPVFGNIDEKIRKSIAAKGGRMVFPSPKSKDGVAEVIEATEGIVKSQMKVTYADSDPVSGKKRTATIKDDEMSEAMDIDVKNELKRAYDEVNAYGKSIKMLHVQTNNHVIDYKQFIEEQHKTNR